MKLCKLKWRWRQMSSEKSLETQLGHREYQVHFGDPLPWSHAHDMGMEQTSPKLCIFDGCLYLGNEAWEDAWRRDGTGELFSASFLTVSHSQGHFWGGWEGWGKTWWWCSRGWQGPCRSAQLFSVHRRSLGTLVVSSLAFSPGVTAMWVHTYY